MTDTTKPRSVIRTPFKILGIIILALIVLAAGAALFAPDDKQQTIASAPAPTGPLAHADAFSVLDVNVPPVDAPFVEIRITVPDGVASDRAATVKVIADRVIHDRSDASAVFVYMQRSAHSVTGGGNGNDLYGRIAEADYTAHPTGGKNTWKVWHSDDSQIISAHDITIGNAFGDLQDKTEAAAGPNADIDVIDAKVTAAIIKKYKLPATWKQQDIPIANGSTDDGAGPANIDASAAETGLKVIDACVKDGGCNDEQAKTFAEIIEGGGEPLTAGSMMQITVQSVGCPNIHSLDIAMKEIRLGDKNSALQALANEVNAGTCAMLPAGSRVSFQHFSGHDDDLAQIKLADGTTVWTLGAVLVGAPDAGGSN